MFASVETIFFQEVFVETILFINKNQCDRNSISDTCALLFIHTKTIMYTLLI